MLRRRSLSLVIGGLLVAVLIPVGGPQPTNATTAPECRVWVSSTGSASFTVIDSWTSNPSTFTIDTSISDFTFNRSGSKVFASTMNGLRMIDASTYQVDTVASGIYAVGQGDFGTIAASPTADRVIATTNQNVGNYPFAILNSETGSVVNTSSLVARSIDVVFDPAGNAFAADFQFQLASPPGRIDKIDVSVPASTMHANLNLAYWETYSSMAIAAPAGQSPILFVGSNQNTNVSNDYFMRAIDTSNLTVLANITMPTSPAGMAVSASGDRLFVSQFGNDEVTVFDTVSRNVVALITVGQGPSGMAVTPDGRFLFVVNSLGSSLSKIDLTTLAVVETIVVSPYPSKVAIGPAGCVSVEPAATPTTSVAPATSVAPLPTTGSDAEDGSSATIGIFLVVFGGVMTAARRRRLMA